MSKRKYLRSIALHNMKAAGIERINKKRVAFNPKTGMTEPQPSKFAENWRKYC